MAKRVDIDWICRLIEVTSNIDLEYYKGLVVSLNMNIKLCEIVTFSSLGIWKLPTSLSRSLTLQIMKNIGQLSIVCFQILLAVKHIHLSQRYLIDFSIGLSQ